MNNVVVTLVKESLNIRIHDIIYKNQETREVQRIARIFETRADNSDGTSVYRVQAVRLYENSVSDTFLYKTFTVESLFNASEKAEKLVKILSNDSKQHKICSMRMESSLDVVKDKHGKELSKCIVVRLQEDNVESVNKDYKPVIIEYIFQEDNSKNIENQYRLQIVRFPQDLYERDTV